MSIIIYNKDVLLKKLIFCYFFFGVIFSQFFVYAINHYDNISMNGNYANPVDSPIENIISRRLSIKNHYYSNIGVPKNFIMKLLWASYGYNIFGRTVSNFSTGYSVKIYVSDANNVSLYNPITNSLSLWKIGDYRRLSEGYEAPIQLYIVVDMNICHDIKWGNAEAGGVVQNIYLMSNALNLGTVCQGGNWLNRTLIQEELGLPENETVLFKMPIGFPLAPFSEYENLIETVRPSSNSLPEIQDSTMNLEEALTNAHLSKNFSPDNISSQELSQILWSAYGYSYYEDISNVRSIERHRTVASAHGYYPLKIYAANTFGLFEYLPDEHGLRTVVEIDVRENIALVTGNLWASKAPVIIIICWDSSHILTVETTYAEVGLVTQNIILESTAWGLVSFPGKINENELGMKDILKLQDQPNIHPLLLLTVGAEKSDIVFGELIRNPSSEIINPGIKVNVSVPITDLKNELKNVTFYYTLNNDTNIYEIEMNFDLISNSYQVMIPTQKNGTKLEYNIVAFNKYDDKIELENTPKSITYYNIFVNKIDVRDDLNISDTNNLIKTISSDLNKYSTYVIILIFLFFLILFIRTRARN